MRRFTTVTTFNLAGYEETGKRMVESYVKHWPASVPLTVYTEGDLVRLTLPVLTREIESIVWLREFKARHKDNREAHGLRRSAGGFGTRYSFRRDAVKFAHKTAVVIETALRLQGGDTDALIWLDADIVTHAPVETRYLETLLPEDAAIAWLDRAAMYPECGFYILNLRHPEMCNILRQWEALYTSDGLFRLSETHDSFVLQKVIAGFDVRTHSLSGSASATTHPLARGPLSARFDHLKGSRKTLSYSPEHTLLERKMRRQKQAEAWERRRRLRITPREKIS